jgi:hypothetical protein
MSEADKSAIAILVRVNSDRIDPGVFGCSNDPNSNFASVGNEQLRNSGHTESLGRKTSHWS